MAQSTTNLGKIHVFPSESLYNQFKDVIAANDLALLKDDGAYIVAALLEQNGYVKFSNGLILQWGKYQDEKIDNRTVDVYFPIKFNSECYGITVSNIYRRENSDYNTSIKAMVLSYFTAFIDDFAAGFYYIAIGK